MSSWRISDSLMMTPVFQSSSRRRLTTFASSLNGKRRHTFGGLGRRLNLKDITCPSIQSPAKLPSTTQNNWSGRGS